MIAEKKPEERLVKGRNYIVDSAIFAKPKQMVYAGQIDGREEFIYEKAEEGELDKDSPGWIIGYNSHIKHLIFSDGKIKIDDHWLMGVKNYRSASQEYSKRQEYIKKLEMIRGNGEGEI